MLVHIVSAHRSKSAARRTRPYARFLIVLIFFVTGAQSPALAQWEIQSAPTTADLRGIHALANGVAWASGTEGTVLRTTDGGKTWQRCATPPDAEHLDFRGIQAFDATTAIVMSSGKGPLSRLYKTTDACQSWTLLFTNPDPDGSFDSVRVPLIPNRKQPSLMLLGDPVDGLFKLWDVDPFAADGNHVTTAVILPQAMKGETVFAASNSSLFVVLTGNTFLFGTGGSGGARIVRLDDPVEHPPGPIDTETPIGHATATSGVFSIAVGYLTGSTVRRWWRPYIHDSDQFPMQRAVAVGGDYRSPDNTASVAAYCKFIDSNWHAMRWYRAQTQPHGYRSAVDYSPTSKAWITVGPNGTDISTDDGRNWRALKPTAAEPPDADQHWNALSLPFVVGPHGRIGRLRPAALNPAPQGAKP